MVNQKKKKKKRLEFIPRSCSVQLLLPLQLAEEIFGGVAGNVPEGCLSFLESITSQSSCKIFGRYIETF